jgi:hypothetical protein
MVETLSQSKSVIHHFAGPFQLPLKTKQPSLPPAERLNSGLIVGSGGVVQGSGLNIESLLKSTLHLEQLSNATPRRVGRRKPAQAFGNPHTLQKSIDGQPNAPLVLRNNAVSMQERTFEPLLANLLCDRDAPSASLLCTIPPAQALVEDGAVVQPFGLQKPFTSTLCGI